MSHTSKAATRSRRTILILTTTGLLFALAFGIALGGPRPPAPAPAVSTTPTAEAAATEARGDDPATRVAIAPEAPPPVAATTAEPSFEQRVEELAQIARRTAELAEQDDLAAATASDQTARERFGELMQRFEDAGERGLAMLAAMPVPDLDPLTPARRGVLRVVLQGELQRRHETALAVQDHTRVDALVGNLLDLMPGTEFLIADGEWALADRPYLRLLHEPAVLSLVRLSSEERFPRPVATRLLLTLWHNLQATGERSSDELSRLALLMLADGDPSQRTAACRQLLLDARYRPLVLSWLRERGDRTIANEIASLAARDLPPTAALDVLRELGPLLPRLPAAYMTLGFRAPEVLADAYRELLASNTQPSRRTDLLAGVAMAPGEIGVELAQFALDNDPSPDVCLQAMFAFCTRRDVMGAEAAINRVLDDEAVRNDPARLDAVVLAFQNLEAGGDVNVIDRVGQRLSNLPLSPASRQLLAGILQRALPGGEFSTPR
ncbi:MAG: hypothetical protein K8J09_01235 [Planctomycetes bacterium]|nr:hypothetical protein [Planctomycetota bacterium]MCC7398849.1 hypothetical protein [Planctomycetota bacterium]